MLSLLNDYDTVKGFFNDSFYKSTNYSFQNTDTGYKLSILVPGFEKEEISIRAEKEDLIIEAKTEREDFPTYLKKQIKRSFYAQDLDPESITANLSSGILTIEFTTDKKSSAKTITIN